jgi:Zn-dependent peptidase ImmA (M78 family)
MMTKNKRMDIRRKAEAVRILFDLNEFPLDFEKILEGENINLYLSDLDELSMGEISGILNIDGADKSIYLNNKHAETRNLFTVGHELGHYYLHQEQLKNNNGQMISYRGKSKSKVEREADLFSAELIMPKSEMLKIAQKGKNSVREMAEYFGVSQLAMTYRIIDINKELKEEA